jgi:hypothetical protein
MSNFADEERELAEREFEDERYFASHCTTYDELREVRMGIVPARVLDRAHGEVADGA